jgi:hypothetical protein
MRNNETHHIEPDRDPSTTMTQRQRERYSCGDEGRETYTACIHMETVPEL